MKPALDAISGLSLTASNYEEVIAILKKWFRNKQQIINCHMDILVNVSPVINEDTRKLRELYDTLESDVRCLKLLGLPYASGSHGSLLSSFTGIMNKLPQELRLIISREIKDQEWHLNTIMRVLENELEARERAVHHDESQLSKSSVMKPESLILIQYCMSSVEPGHVQSSQALLERNVVSEEDETYAKSMLGGVEETSSSEQKVLGVRWNPL